MNSYSQFKPAFSEEETGQILQLTEQKHPLNRGAEGQPWGNPIQSNPAVSQPMNTHTHVFPWSWKMLKISSKKVNMIQTIQYDELHELEPRTKLCEQI